MKNTKLFIFGVAFLTLNALQGQNLVVNPSFETAADSVSIIPPGEFSISKALGWTLPTRAQASLFSSLPTLATLNRSLNRWKFTAKEGNNVASFTTYGSLAGDEKNELREYLQGKFTRPLTVGKKYFVAYWVHFHCEGTNNIGFSFTTTPLSTDSVFRLPLKPLINNTTLIPYSSATWTLVRDSFIAREPFQYFIMGNFLSNRETKIESNKYHYHKAYIDNIVIEEAPDEKMPPRIFDLATDNQPNMPAIIKPSPPSVTTVSEDKNKNPELVTPPAAAEKPTAVKGETLILDKVFFPYNSTVLETESSIQLEKLVAFLQKNATMKILVKGHTSSEGSDSYNQKLSENRAQSVVNFLIQKGIKSERLSFKGYGKTQAIYPSDTEENRHKNRRVEFEILGE